jgi:conjugative transfer signal peptidase TraF
MTERHDLPLFAHCAGTARAIAQGARRARVRRRRVAAIAAGGVALIGLTIAAPPLPRLVWNASASAPIGLYTVHPGAAVTRGAMVIAWAPARARLLAARRHYLPLDVPLVKRVMALPGDHVCTRGPAIAVNGRVIAKRRPRDAAGRAMPWWRGCGTLENGAVLLINDAPASFDGRYFGPTNPRDLIGKASALWVR